MQVKDLRGYDYTSPLLINVSKFVINQYFQQYRPAFAIPGLLKAQEYPNVREYIIRNSFEELWLL